MLFAAAFDASRVDWACRRRASARRQRDARDLDSSAGEPFDGFSAG